MSSASGKPARRTPGGPVLQDDVTDALAVAFFDELAAVGYGRLSIEAVARRAGTGKAAVYRRWPSKQAMTVALVSRAAVASVVAPDMGSLREDIAQFLRAAREALEHSVVSRIVPDLLAEASRNDELAEALMATVRTPRRAAAARILQRAIERGELPGDIDIELGLDFLGGPVYWRLIVVRTPTGDDYLERLTSKVIGALTA